MPRYADIDKATELAARTMVNGSQVAYVVMGLPNFVENILNNAEVEAGPIVRCKDRIHLHDHDCPIDWGKTDDDYCSFGERKDEVEHEAD